MSNIKRANWVDPASGCIGFSASGVSHGEPIDTFFIVPLMDLPVLLSKKKVTERRNMFSDAKWKPKELTFADGDAFEITDPSHVVEVTNPETGKVRKKTVTATVMGHLVDTLADLIKVSCGCAYFEISQYSHKTSKDVKVYTEALKVWDEVCENFGFSAKELKLEANKLHYGMRL